MFTANDLRIAATATHNDDEPTMWDYELTELTITDADGYVLVNGFGCNNHDHLSRTAQEWADRLGKPVYITSDDDALNEEVEPSEDAEDAEAEVFDSEVA